MEDKDKTTIASLVAGVLFGVGWWLLGDAAGYAAMTEPKPVSGEYIIPGLLATLALILLNIWNWSDLTGGGLEPANASKAKVLLFVSVLLMLGALVGSLWILIQDYAQSSIPDLSIWPGVAIVLQTFFIILSGIVLRFGRAKEFI